MPTIIGVIFFCSGAYCFLRKEGALLGLLLLSTLFEASSALNVAGRGIQPHYVVAGFIIARALVNRVFRLTSSSPAPHGKWLLLFGGIAIISTLTLPIVFAGTPIYDPKIGIDDGLFIRPPLSFGVNNIAQAVFVAWHIGTAFALLRIKSSEVITQKFYIFVFYVGLFFIFVQSFSSLTGIPYPDTLIRNNPGYEISGAQLISHGVRCPGTFTEPSYAGTFFLMYCVGFLVEYLEGKGGIFRIILALIATGLIASSGALLALVICLSGLTIRYFPFRFPWYIKVGRAKRLASISSLVLPPLLLVLVVSASYRDTIVGLTVSKGDTGSFANRTASDLYALQLLVQTHGIGVGLGSNRASSLLTTLLSTIGVMGALSFGVFYVKLFRSLPRNYAWLRWAAYAVLINMCIDIPDVTTPILWFPVLIAIPLTMNRVRAWRPLPGSNLALVEA
jgi:hypothetical protein